MIERPRAQCPPRPSAFSTTLSPRPACRSTRCAPPPPRLARAADLDRTRRRARRRKQQFVVVARPRTRTATASQSIQPLQRSRARDRVPATVAATPERSKDVPEIAGQAVGDIDRAATRCRAGDARARPAAPAAPAARSPRSRAASASVTSPRRQARPSAPSPRCPRPRSRRRPLRPTAAARCPRGTSPSAVIEIVTPGVERVVSPPASAHPCRSASANMPRVNAASQASSTRGSASARKKQRGCRAAGGQVGKVDGERLVARAPRDRRRRRKCTPSTSMSVVTAHCSRGPPSISAQSSPMPSSTRGAAPPCTLK